MRKDTFYEFNLNRLALIDIFLHQFAKKCKNMWQEMCLNCARVKKDPALFVHNWCIYGTFPEWNLLFVNSKNKFLTLNCNHEYWYGWQSSRNILFIYYFTFLINLMGINVFCLHGRPFNFSIGKKYMYLFLFFFFLLTTFWNFNIFLISAWILLYF